MIEGIKLDFSADELQAHFTDRAAFHGNKREWYAAQVASLRSGGLSASNVTNDPISSLERSRDEHGQRQAFFQLLAAHLVPGETYRLADADLVRVELYARFF